MGAAKRLDALVGAELLDRRRLGLGVGDEVVDGDGDRQTEFVQVLEMTAEIDKPFFSAATFSVLSSSLVRPPCIFSARMVATTTAADGKDRPCGT